MKVKSIIKLFVDPLFRFNYFTEIGINNILSDKTFLQKKYKLRMNKKLDLSNPQTFSEKLQWLKLYDREKIYTKLVDKYEVKSFVAKTIGNEYIISTIGVFDKFEDIDFSKLPKQFVIKCTHDSGGLVVVKDKNEINIKEIKKQINKYLNRNFYYLNREWPYKNIRPRIIIEKYMEDNKTKELRDYKFFCFNGKVKFMFIATDRSKHETKFNFYDLNFKLLPFKQHYPNDDRQIEKPANFDKMISLAEKLAKNIPHVRIDFYEVNGKIYFGEFTFYHFAGFMPFEPELWDKKIGDMIDLSLVKKNEK